MKTCRLCGRPIEHRGTVCVRCWKVRSNNTPQANAAADLDAFWLEQAGPRLPVVGAA